MMMIFSTVPCSLNIYKKRIHYVFNIYILIFFRYAADFQNFFFVFYFINTYCIYIFEVEREFEKKGQDYKKKCTTTAQNNKKDEGKKNKNMKHNHGNGILCFEDGVVK